jgi:Phage integrase, N-terminal SAM-like domain
MSIDVVSPLRQRMIEDMTARKLGAGTQRLYISSCKRFAAFFQRSPDIASVEDIRRFQLHLAETGTSIPNRNRIMTGLRFLFRVTLRRLDLAAEIYHLREPQKIPQVISPDEARTLLAVANSLRTRLLLSLALRIACQRSGSAQGRSKAACSQARTDDAEPRDTTGGRAGPQTEHFISAYTWGGPDPEAQTHATPSAVTGHAVSRQRVERWRPDAQTGSAWRPP